MFLLIKKAMPYLYLSFLYFFEAMLIEMILLLFIRRRLTNLEFYCYAACINIPIILIEIFIDREYFEKHCNVKAILLNTVMLLFTAAVFNSFEIHFFTMVMMFYFAAVIASKFIMPIFKRKTIKKEEQQ